MNSLVSLSFAEGLALDNISLGDVEPDENRIFRCL